MDEYNGKKAGKGPSFSRRGSSISFRDPIQDGRNIQYCNRLGCSTRLNSMKGTQVSTPEKLKCPKASFRSTSSKAMATGSSSKSLSASTDLRKSYQERRNQYPFRETAESSSRQRVIEDSDSSSKHEGTENSEFSLTTTEIHNIDEVDSPIIQGSTSTSTKSSGSRPQKQINQRLASNSQDTASSSSFRRSISSRSIVQAPRLASQSLGTGSQRYGLKNLSCTSISDVLPSGCSLSDSSQSRRVVSVRKRPSDEESLSGGRVAAGVSSSSLSGPRGSQMPQQASRRARNRPVSRDGPVSVRTRRPSSGETRMRLPEQVDDNIASISEPSVFPQLPHTQLPLPDAASASSSRSFPIDPPPVFHSPFGRSNVSSRSARSRLGSRPEDGGPQIFHGPLGDRDSYRRFNMEGIAEVLLALERIEQDEELTYEQLLVLETNLFLGGLSFHDQHRDMRLDIDNMTYEELLALEEKMGNVSTALSEEALSKCLKRSMYSPASQIPGITARGDDDIKCSVCQEEYVVGDEVGKLACGHRYHVLCIHQWLRQKNWCPICKASATSPC